MKVQKRIETIRIIDHINGAIVGFMVGDALGLPVAGLPKSFVTKTIPSIRNYVINPYHPFLSFLKKGQYGGNARLLITTLESLIENDGYHHQNLYRSLQVVGKKSIDNKQYSRWMGERVIKALITGKPFSSESCTCIYRSIPIALLFHDYERVIMYSRRQAKLTHSSQTSLAAAFFISHMLFYLKYGNVEMGKLVQEAIRTMQKDYPEAKKLITHIKLVVSGKITSTREARKVLGTGSQAFQTIPLALFIYMKHREQFARAVRLGANSFRVDTKEEKQKLKNLNFEEQLIACRGGDTNAIAGLVGCFIGCEIGYKHIPSSFTNGLEDRERILALTARLLK